MNFPPALLACATCMVDQGSDVYRASTAAIMFMVGLIGAVLGVVLFIIINFARKQRRFSQLNPDLQS